MKWINGNIKYRDAFTLIEIIVTLCIIAIILSVALVSTASADITEERLSIKALASDLEFIRNDSIINNRKNELRVFGGGSKYQILTHNEGFSISDSRRVKIEEKYISENLKFAKEMTIGFSIGGISKSGGSILIKKNNKSCYKVTCDVGVSQIRYYELE